MRSVFFLFLLVAACTALMPSWPVTSTDYKTEALLPDEGAVVGRVKVVYNGVDRTWGCAVCFAMTNGRCYGLGNSRGFVAMTLQAGPAAIRRVECKLNGIGDQYIHFQFENATFEVAPRAKTYFGDLTIDWKNGQAFKPSELFGPIGLILDQSYNDGAAAISVAGGRDEILAWYAAFMEKDDHLPLTDSVVSPVAAQSRPAQATPPTRLQSGFCTPLVPAVVTGGADLYQGPDQTSGVIARFEAATAVCAGKSQVGFGFRRIKVPAGPEGFVRETDISL